MGIPQFPNAKCCDFYVGKPWVHSQVAEKFLLRFVQESIRIYTRGFATYNVDSLTHLVSDAVRLGPITENSAFVFESFLGKLKNYVCSEKHLLVQIVKRVHEIHNFSRTQANRKEI